jgi:diguanylate cyclase (GGDEF)-like protein
MRSFRNAVLPAYIGTISVIGWLGLLAGAIAWHDHPSAVDTLWLPCFAAAVILGECFPVKLWRTEGEVTVSVGFSLALLWLAGPAAVLLIQAAAVLIAEFVSRRRSLARMTFNVGQLSIAWIAATVVMRSTDGSVHAMAGGSGHVVHAVGSIAAAGVAFSAVNMFLTAVAPALHGGVPVREVLAGFGRTEILTVGMLIGFAPVIVLTVQTTPLLLPLLGLPLAAVRIAGMALTRSEHQALHDLLTGLPNRSQMRRHLFTMAGEGPVAVLSIDLDRFKEVNDSLGHTVGDEVLCRTAALLQARLPKHAVLSRVASHGLVVLAPGAGAAEATALAQELQRAVETVPDVDGMRIEMGAAVGVALAPEHGVNPDVLVRRSEIAMDEAKAQRDRVALYRPGTDEAAHDRLRLVGELREAIEAGEIDVHYQPKLDLATGALVGAEALARWSHPRRGNVPPGVFVPLAEAGGLIGALGSVVLDRAVAQAAQWRQEGLELHVAVNVSVRRLLEDGVVEEVTDCLRRHGVPARALEIEITESVFLDDPERARAVLAALHALGVSVAVDDYGTGYSSLSYLRDLPVDTLKLDRAFISGILECPADEAIVSSTVLLAHNLGLTVVAEGIEDEATLQAVRRLGCDQAQGFHIGRPQPPAALAEQLRSAALAA